MKISQKIYTLRTEKDMTQAQIAKIAGVSDKSVSAWEAGKREPKVKAIQNICSYFGLDLNAFIDEQSDELTDSNEKQLAELSELSDSEKHLIQLLRQLPKEVRDSYPTLLEASLKAQGLL